MKSGFLSLVFGISLVLCTFLTGQGCESSTDKNTHVPVNGHGQSKAYTSTYVCPMHCEGSGSEKAGICPVCGMTYEVLTEHVKNGHVH